MENLIPVSYEGEQPTVSGRELHAALEIGTEYKDWFPRMCEYGFTEGEDFNPLKIERVQPEGTRDVRRMVTDHALTIPMAKELCMLQRNEKGKMFRQYFIKVEEAWNSPDMVMKRALAFANKRVEQLMEHTFSLETTVAVQEQQISELKPKASYYDVVLNCKDLLSATEIAKDYGKSAKWLNEMLHELGIQFKQSGVWLLYQKYAEKGYTSTKTHNYPDENGEIHSKVHTYWTQKGRLFIYDLLKSHGILPIMEQAA